MKKEHLLPDFWEESKIAAKPMSITYKVSEHKVTVVKGVVRDLFFKKEQLFVVIETGLAIHINDIVGLSF